LEVNPIYKRQNGYYHSGYIGSRNHKIQETSSYPIFSKSDNPKTIKNEKVNFDEDEE